MNTNIIYKILSTFLILCWVSSCGSGEIIPTKDVCSLVKHPKDMLYQVRVNNQKINDRYYLKEDGLDITKMLAKDNKCMP